MITCEVFRRHVDAVVDGEVDPTTLIEFEQHLTECGPCRVQLSFARSHKRWVKEALVEAAPAVPVGLEERIRSALSAEDNRRAAERWDAPVGASSSVGPPLGLAGVRFVPIKARYAVPAAAAAVTLAVLAAHEGGNPAFEGAAVLEGATAAGGVEGNPVVASAVSYLEDVVDRHWREHPAEVSGPPTQVASWFRGKLEFTVRPIEFAHPGARLVGARLSSVRDRQAAAFYYDVQGHRVTVLVFEPGTPIRRAVHSSRVDGRGIHYGHARGHTVSVVEHDGLTYAIAGDLDQPTLLRLAASARVRDH